VATPYPETGCPVTTLIEKTPVTRAAGEFAPQVTLAVLDALADQHPAGLRLYIAVQQLPAGFEPTDALLMRRARFTPTMLRKAKRALHAAGLFTWDTIRTAAGRFVRICRYLTNPPAASSQVAPSDPPRSARLGSRIPLSNERTERAPHDPDRCARDAAGLPCRACGEARKAAKPEIRVPKLPAYRPIGEVLAQEYADGPLPGPAAVEVPDGFDYKAQLDALWAKINGHRLDRNQRHRR
jgi:hypothetical protein